MSFTEERTYQALLGPLGLEPTVWAECLFVDPVGDIAVLGAPDDQPWEAYVELIEQTLPVPIRAAREIEQAWLCSLDGHLFRCKVERATHMTNIGAAAEEIRGGMSGSPIVADDGKAIGIVGVSLISGSADATREGGPNPSLSECLPGWLLRELLDSADLLP